MDAEKTQTVQLSLHAVIMSAEDGKLMRVLEVSPDEDLVIVAVLHKSSTLPRRLRYSEVVAAISCRRYLPVEYADRHYLPQQISEATLAKFGKVKPALQTLLGLGYRRLSDGGIWKTIKATAKAHEIKPNTLNGLLGKVIQSGGVLLAAAGDYSRSGRRPNAVDAPRPTNDPRGFPLSVTDLQNIREGAKGYQGSITWREAYTAFLEKYYPEKIIINNGRKIIVPLPPSRRPSFRQFHYHAGRMLGLRTMLENKYGKRVVETKHRGKPNGHSEYAIYPGTVSELDWTLIDMVAVSRGSRLSIGRLSLYVIADTHSGMVQSVYLTFGDPNYGEACKAILGCLENKGELMAKYTVPFTSLDWPVTCLPTEFRCDKGEVDSWKAQGLVNFAGINIEYCVSKRPDQKGTCESFFAVMRWQLRRMRGGTSGMKERLSDHPNITAIYDFDQVYRLLLNLVIKFNARERRRQSLTQGMVADGVLRVPNKLWKWAAERGCIRDYSLEKARMEILPCVEASITSEGIRVKGLHYRLPTFSDIDPDEWLMRARQKSFMRSFTYDPSTVDYVYLIHKTAEGQPQHVSCPLSEEDKGWAGMSWQEYELMKKQLRESHVGYSENEQRQIIATADADIKKLTSEAKTKTRELREGLSSRDQIKGTQARREAEKPLPTVVKPQGVVQAKASSADDFLNDDWSAKKQTA